MKLTRKRVLVLGVVALAVTAVVGVPTVRKWRRTAYRRRWKNDAVKHIARRYEDTAWIREQVRAAENEEAGLYGEGADCCWLREDIIVMEDGGWIVYRAVARKADERIDDIFIGRASDGKWYFSTYHFCKYMIVLGMMSSQPPDLARFVRAFSVVEFDGRSDKCLEETWDGTCANGYGPDAPVESGGANE